MDRNSRIPCSATSSIRRVVTTQRYGETSGLTSSLRNFRGSTAFGSASSHISTANRKSLHRGSNIFSAQKPRFSVISSSKKRGIFSMTPQNNNRYSFHGGSASSRRSSIVGARHVKDTRLLTDRTFQQQCITKIIEFLGVQQYPHVIRKQFLQSFSTAELNRIFQFIFSFLGDNLNVEPLNQHVPLILKDLYPFSYNKSSFVSATSNNARGQLLGILDWLIDVVKYTINFDANTVLFPVSFEEETSVTGLDLLKIAWKHKIEHDELSCLIVEKFGTEEDLDIKSDMIPKFEEELNMLENEIEELNMMPSSLLQFCNDTNKYDIYISKMKDHTNASEEGVNEIEKEIERQNAELELLVQKRAELTSMIDTQQFNINDVEWNRERQKQIDEEICHERNNIESLNKKIRIVKLESTRNQDTIKQYNADAMSSITLFRDTITRSKTFSSANNIIKYLNRREWDELATKFEMYITEDEESIELRKKFSDMIYEVKKMMAEHIISIKDSVSSAELQKLQSLDTNISEIQKQIDTNKKVLQTRKGELDEMKMNFSEEIRYNNEESERFMRLVKELDQPKNCSQKELMEKTLEATKNLKKEVEERKDTYNKERIKYIANLKTYTENANKLARSCYSNIQNVRKYTCKKNLQTTGIIKKAIRSYEAF